ncbi:hypothetical protein Dimus_004954, partial [Dionaea muscipula]
EFIQYYKQLSGSSTMISRFDDEIIAMGKVNPEDTAVRLIKPVDNDEIKKALWSIGDNKAPDPDVNNSKSNVYCAAMEDGLVEDVKRITGFQLGELPFTYLGIPINAAESNPEIERTLRSIRTKRRLEFKQQSQEEMDDPPPANHVPAANGAANQRPLREYAAPQVNGALSGIVQPPVNANNFELKPGLIQMLQ